MTKTTKILSISLIVVIILILAGGVSYTYNRKSLGVIDPSKTIENTKTYTNEKYGYSIKYPSNIQLEEPDRSNVGEKDSQQGTILNLDNDSYVSVSVWNKNAVDAYDSKEWADFGYQKITIDGHKALKGREYGNGYFIETYVYGDNYTYEIKYAGTENTANIDTYNQILSTFKFTR